MAEKWQLKAVLSASAESMLKTLNGVSKTARTTRKYLLDVGKSAGNLSGKLGLPFAALSGAVGGLSVVAVKNAITGFTTLGEEVSKGAIKAGMTTDEYQRMRYVAEQADTSVESLGAAMGKLNRNAGDAAVGKNKNLSALFQKLGINVRGANGEVRRGIDLLPDLADAFQRNENPAVRARMGMAMFGKQWQEIAPLLAEGSAGITQNLERLSRLKSVIPAEDIRGAKELGDRFKDLNMVFRGFQMTVAKELAPVIGPLVEQLTAWWVANKKLVSVEVARMAREFGEWIKSIDFKEVLRGVQDFFKSVGRLVDQLGGAKNALIALVVFMNLPAIIAAVGLGAAFLKLGIFAGGLALSLLAPIAPLQVLQAEMVAANLKGAALIGTFGKIAAAAGIAGAAYVGYQFGGWLNDNVVNPTVQMMTGQKDASLGSWLYDKLHPEDGAASRPSLVQGGAQKVGGEIKVSFDNAPPGMRVDQGPQTGPVALNTDVGYRSFAMGMP
jgi:hypothetical protein